MMRLASLVLKHKDKVLARARDIVKGNLSIFKKNGWKMNL
ncbi:hypothetical protein ICE98_03711 [Lactococcus lactis]|nr:hypothetical protein [Lactococcus lactis]